MQVHFFVQAIHNSLQLSFVLGVSKFNTRTVFGYVQLSNLCPIFVLIAFFWGGGGAEKRADIALGNRLMNARAVRKHILTEVYSNREQHSDNL